MASEPALLQDDEQAIISETVKSDKSVICYEPPEYHHIHRNYLIQECAERLPLMSYRKSYLSKD